MSNTIQDHMTLLPHSINQEATLAKAEEMMQEFRCHHLPVLSGGTLQGIISDKDLQYVRKEEDKETLKVVDFMTPDVITVNETIGIKEAIQTMVDNNINSLIVSGSSDTPWGIFTSTNALAFCAKYLD